MYFESIKGTSINPVDFFKRRKFTTPKTDTAIRRPPPHANGLFDLQNRYASLSEAGDPLERLNAVIDWEMFRSILSRIDPTQRKSAAGRKPTCRVLIFKMLILQRLRNLSDERLQYPVSDRLSLMRFLDLELAGNVPDDTHRVGIP